MANGVHSNTSLANGLAPNPHVQKNPVGFWGKTAEIASALIYQPIKHCRYLIAPSKAPKDALRKIDDLAKEGLKQAAGRRIETEAVAAHFQGHLDKTLLQRQEEIQKTAIKPNVGPVAKISSVPDDPEMTLPPSLKAQADAIDWKKEGPLAQKDFVNQLSAYTTLLQMASRCGKKEDHLELMNLAKRATEKGTSLSVWALFTAKYQDLTLWEKIKAAWFYWFYYQTSLISDTVEAYVGSFLTETRDALIQDSDIRNALFSEFLENADEFLAEDFKAAKSVAFEKVFGSLKSRQNWAIEKVYDFALDRLCQACTEKWVARSPKVRFFAPLLQDIPIFGLVFKGFEWLINRFMIQQRMRSSLPKILESVVREGLKETAPYNLPFSLSITQFLTSRLEQLRINLEQQGDTPKATSDFLCSDLLSPAIKNLIKDLALVPSKTSQDKTSQDKTSQDKMTSQELRKKIESIESKSNKSWFQRHVYDWEGQLEESIQEGIIEAANLLFHDLNERAKSGELSTRLLRLASDAFSRQVKDPDLLMAQYKEERANFKRIAREVIEKTIRSVVAKKVNGDKPEHAKRIAESAFHAKKTIAQEACTKLAELCQSITKKLSHPEIDSIQTDIAAFFQIMKIFATRKEIQDEIGNLKPIDRDPIWRILTPLYEKAANIESKLLHFQELQGRHPSLLTVKAHLEEIPDLLQSIRNSCLSQQPKHPQDLKIQALERSANAIGKRLEPEAPIPIKLRASIPEIAQFTESIVKEQMAIDAIHALYSPRMESSAPTPPGLLDQLLNYERGLRQSDFKLSSCRKKIEKQLESFSSEEQQELKTLIGNGTQLKAKWDLLSATLQRIYQKHKDLQERNQKLLDNLIDVTSQWAQKHAIRFTLFNEQNREEIQKIMREISGEVEALKKEVENATLHVPPSLSPWPFKIGTTAAAAGAGAGLVWVGGALGGTVGSFLGPVGTATGAAIGTAAGAALGTATYTGTQNLGRLLNGNSGAFLKTAAAAMVGGGVSYLVPGSVTYLTAAGSAAAAGWNHEKAIHNFGQDLVVPKVMGIFDKAYDFLLQSRVWKALATRTLKALS